MLKKLAENVVLHACICQKKNQSNFSLPRHFRKSIKYVKVFGKNYFKPSICVGSRYHGGQRPEPRSTVQKTLSTHRRQGNLSAKGCSYLVQLRSRKERWF